ncbi:hypothetical protein JIN85_12955 [Luteolibacter pohnpeiensis]|uniref:Uncharacterized protein n=1 Tax=Luteolibacter pohnpeiensis TaxID=454153 RepID=A0A934SCE4_9BACT|nr:hypothetical protein [Luteolibacter pohnpeiensis]MBK1883329.1 hypothetical protein [Luteolibacter pohnpeiensis]
MTENHQASQKPITTWRSTAAKVTEELFPVSPESTWNDLLDFRQMILHEENWERVLDAFLICRRKLEDDHYLPFYRLRKILASHLQLENAGVSLEVLLRRKNFCLRRWQSVRQKRSPMAKPEVRVVEIR